MIDQEYLKSILDYNPKTGEFIWLKVSKYHNEKLGKRAGTKIKNKGKTYEMIRIKRKGYSSHRLAWLYYFGFEPKPIDHINGDSLDNRIDNLREATCFQNNQNHTRGTKSSGLPVGVSFAKKAYRARITANGVVHHLGTFPTRELASHAYENARDSLHDAPSRGYDV